MHWLVAIFFWKATKRVLLHFEFQMLVKGSSGGCKEQLKLGDLRTK